MKATMEILTKAVVFYEEGTELGKLFENTFLHKDIPFVGINTDRCFIPGIIVYVSKEVARTLFNGVNRPRICTAFPASETFERHKKIPLPDALPDRENKLKCNEDDDYPFQEVRMLDADFI
jgi:hypothetical protein